MGTRTGRRLFAAAAMVVWLASAGFAQTCGVASLFDLCQLAGRELGKDEQGEMVEGYPAEDSSMLHIKQAAEKLELPLLGVAARLDELTDDIPGPKIIHLKDPAHFLVMARASPEWVQLLDGGRVVVVPRAEIEKRYSGHALILEQEDDQGGPRLELEEFHHTFGIAGVGQEVEHSFKVTNVGDQDLLVKPMRWSNSRRATRPASEVISPPSKSRQISRPWRKVKEVSTARSVSKAGASRNSVLAYYHAISTLLPGSFLPSYE